MVNSFADILGFKADINSEYPYEITIFSSMSPENFNWVSPNLLALILLEVWNISLAFSENIIRDKC